MNSLTIVLDTNDFIAVQKPAMMLTIPSRNPLEDRRPCLKSLLEMQLGIKLFVIHRLDFEVSGLVLFAKNALSHAAANNAFAERHTLKTYEATSEMPPEFSGRVGQEYRWEFLLVRGKKRSFEAAHGKPAITRGRIESLDLHSRRIRWTLWPETGRSHQLRLSLAKIGSPILGDTLYGSKIPPAVGQGIELRAVALSIPSLGLGIGG